MASPSYNINTNDIMQAINARQFKLSLQPIINIEEETFETLEAFIRWDHPKFGLLSPASFMPQIMKSGFQSKLTNYIIQEAIDISNRSQKSCTPFGVNINIHLHELMDIKTLSALHKHLHILKAKEDLCFEISPNIITDYFQKNKIIDFSPDQPPSAEELKSLEEIKETIEVYEETGITLILDTTQFVYGALERAKILGLHAIKISPQCLSNPAYLVKSVEKSQHYNIPLVVTAVERADQLQTAIASGINYAQGKILCSPAFEEGLTNWNKEEMQKIKEIAKGIQNVRNSHQPVHIQRTEAPIMNEPNIVSGTETSSQQSNLLQKQGFQGRKAPNLKSFFGKK